MAATKSATPKATKKLTLSFGELMSAPIGYAPIADEARKKIKGKLTCPEHGPGVQYSYVCGKGGSHEHVLESRPDSAYPHPDDSTKYVFVDKAVREEIAEEGTGMIDVQHYVDLDSVNPTYLDQTYLVWADAQNPVQQQTYDLFLAVLREDRKAAVATIVLGGQTVQIVLHFDEREGVPVFHTCLLESQLRRGNIDLVRAGIEDSGFSDEYLALARQVMASKEGEFDVTEVTDTYTPMFEDAIRAAANGSEFVVEKTQETAAPAGDLLAALKTSVEKAKASTAKPKKKPAKQAA